jgi:hypothetical protein
LEKEEAPDNSEGATGASRCRMDPSSRGEPILALSLHARNPYYYYYYYYYYYVERAEIAASIKLYELPLPSKTY